MLTRILEVLHERLWFGKESSPVTVDHDLIWDLRRGRHNARSECHQKYQHQSGSHCDV
jgi:hypothetical protein